MLHYIRGHITETMPGMVVIENNGIGYEVSVPEGSSAFLAQPDEEIIIYTAMVVKEDDVSLCGFTEKDQLALFHQLITVSGVGPKAAMGVLGAFRSASECRRAIFFEDTASISKGVGIGKKTAQRIVLELKDKVGDPSGFEAPAGTAAVHAPVKGSAKDEALQALVSLGYTKSEAMSFMNGITEEDLSAEEYIRLALRHRR